MVLLVVSACGEGESGGGVLSIADAAKASPGDVATVQGFIVADTAGVRLCEALAESFPPQCGGSFMILTEFDAGAFPQIFSESPGGDVIWTDQAQDVVGFLEAGGIIRVQGLAGLD
jgi:streptogramin lyase